MLLLTEQLASSPVTAHEIKAMTAKDLSKVLQFVLHGWPITAVNDELRPYYRRREELSHFEGCILWGHRVVVPPQAQETILKVLHEGHPGSTRMKQLARGYVWWPNLNKLKVSVYMSITSKGTTSHMALARVSLVTNSPGLCRSLSQQDVLSDYRRTLKVVRSVTCE